MQICATPLAVVLIALLVFAQPAFLFAGEPPKLMPAARDTVVVPYDPKKPLKDQPADKVYLGYDRFLELWEAAKRNREVDKHPFAGAQFALGAARYEGRMEEKRATFTATIELSTFNDPWVRVPLPFREVQIRELSLDGKPAPLVDGALVVEKPGRHTVKAAFEVPLAPGAREFAWGIPQTAATRLSLTVPENRWTVKIQPDAGVIERTVNGRLTVTAALGTTPEVRVTLVEREAAARMAEATLVRITSAVTVSPVFERASAEVESSFPGSQQDKFSVVLSPPGLGLVKLDAPGLRSWILREDAKGQLLEFTLNEPVKEGYKFAVTVERAQAARLPADSAAPWFDAGGKRREYVQELFSGPGTEVKIVPSGSLQQVEQNLKPWDEWTPVGAWTGAEPLKYSVAPASPKREARVDYVYQVNRRKIELIASLKLDAKGAPLFDTTLTLPPDFTVQAVDGQRLQDWWRDGRKLHLRFKGATPEVTPLIVYLVREYPSAPQQLDVQPLTLDGYAKVSGEAVIAAHKGVDAALKLPADGDADPAREVDPANAARDFQILPPLERKRGFAFRNQSFTGQVALAALPVKQNMRWVMHAQAFEAWASLSIKAQISLRQGSIEKTTFSLPATLPEAHVSGGEVRETRSRVEGGRRIYEVAFQNDVYDAVDFTVDVDVTMTEGKRAGDRRVNELALPAPEFPDALLVTGYVLADNASEYEMKLDTDGVDSAPTAEIPWLPSLTKSAGVFRVRPSWKVALALERLEKAGARTAFCAWAEMTTALRNDGTEWHKAVWHLQNRSLQFLPVKLPAGALLTGARVAGQGVRADTGSVNGEPVILIPLIKTRPGDVSYDVEVVWRQPGVRLASRDARKFNGAEVPGITVEQTFWNIWLPDDRALTKQDGNMEEVVAVGREIEKTRSQVEELAQLNKILADESVSQEVWSNAKKNWDAMCRVAEGNVMANSGALQSGQLSLASKDANLDRQKEAEVRKWSGANADVGVRINQLKEDNRRIQEQAQRRQASRGTNLPLNFNEQSQSVFLGNITTNAAGGTIAGGGTLSLSQKPEQQRVLDHGWTSFKAPKDLQAEPPLQPNADTGRNFYLNDNIAFNQADQPAPKSGLSKGGSDSLNREIQMEKKALEIVKAYDRKPGGEADEKSLPVTTKSEGTLEDLNAPVARSFNYARANTLQQREVQQKMAEQRVRSQEEPLGRISLGTTVPGGGAGATATPPPPPGAQPGLALAVQPPAAAAAPDLSRLDDKSKSFPTAYSSAPSDSLFPTLDEFTGKLKPQGRLSLAVDFPTDGHVYHFQKVKGNAALELSFADPRIAQRWTRLAIFVGLAAVLWALGRLVARRAR